MKLKSLAARAVVALSIPLVVGPGALAQEWKLAESPLYTPWAEKVDPKAPLPEYPRPQLVRTNWQNLNGLWDYAVAPRTAAKPDTYTGKILVPFAIQSALSGVKQDVRPDQKIWYRRTLSVQRAAGQRTLLHFAAADWQTIVYVNGKQVGLHRGGYDPFCFDITDAIHASGDNELVVECWDPTDTLPIPVGKQSAKPEGIWYTAVTGIWQTVWTEQVPAAYIKCVKPVAKLDSGQVEITVEAVNVTSGATLDIIVMDGTTQVASVKVDDASKPVLINVPSPKLWTPDTPHLYDLKVTLSAGDSKDEVSSYFAMRSVGIGKGEDGYMRILLNGKPLFHMGPLDQGWWPDGLLTPPSEEAILFDIQFMKDCGFNLARKHMKTEPARWYYHCDKMGLMVWQDMPSIVVKNPSTSISPDALEDANLALGYRESFKEEWNEIINDFGFFPSIVVWTPFNEGWGQHDTNEIQRWTKMLDPTRVINGPSGWTDRGVGDLKDKHHYPPPAMFDAVDDRVSVLGEYGGLGLPIKGHLWKQDANWGYGKVFESKEAVTERYLEFINQMYPMVRRGLAAGVYTQLSDVEIEVNGFLTYDRKVIKIDPKAVKAAHEKLYQPVVAAQLVTVMASASDRGRQAGASWKYSTSAPEGDAWTKPGFDDSKWQSARGGFGNFPDGSMNAATPWSSPDIWLRKTLEINEDLSEPYLRVFYDEDAEVYINGRLVLSAKGYRSDYGEFPIDKSLLKKGTNTIAVHCHQTDGGQYIDVGLVDLRPKK